MTLLENIKPFWPLLFTVVLPRALGYYRALQTAYRTRPPPKPLPRKASRGLNVLFVSTILFLLISTSSRSFMWSEYRNIFSRTQTRLHVPTEVLFTRLASKRPGGTLTALDEELRLKLLTVPSRQLYLRYGPATLLNCPFCHPDHPLTYLLHHLPTNILLPHLLHLISIGLATSSGLSGLIASKFRLRFTLAGIALLVIDIYITTTIDLPHPTPTSPSPKSLYIASTITRNVIFALSNITLAFLIYITATGRFIFFPFLASASNAVPEDPEELLTQTDKLLNETGVALSMAHMRLRGLNVARNTIVRDEGLKRADSAYWETVRGFEEGEGGKVVDESVFEDEEVQAAMARAFGSGNVDVERMRREAKAFVDGVTQDLEKSD